MKKYGVAKLLYYLSGTHHPYRHLLKRITRPDRYVPSALLSNRSRHFLGVSIEERADKKQKSREFVFQRVLQYIQTLRCRLASANRLKRESGENPEQYPLL